MLHVYPRTLPSSPSSPTHYHTHDSTLLHTAQQMARYTLSLSFSFPFPLSRMRTLSLVLSLSLLLLLFLPRTRVRRCSFSFLRGLLQYQSRTLCIKANDGEWKGTNPFSLSLFLSFSLSLFSLSLFFSFSSSCSLSFEREQDLLTTDGGAVIP